MCGCSRMAFFVKEKRMYGRGSGAAVGAVTTASGIASIAILPNTGSLMQAIASIIAIVAGSLILGSFVATRIITKFYR